MARNRNVAFLVYIGAAVGGGFLHALLEKVSKREGRI
jgi:hypothetical protein